MREYLFRGKRLDNGEWVYGYGAIDNEILTLDFAKGIVRVECVPETVGQFTGLTDKNGRKIFERDVLSWVDWKGIKRSSCVQYDAEWNRFCVRLSGAESIGVNRHLSSDIEVIGNRWDNPELLEGV
ncbi:YopX family protein [Faecalispora jeddahensis]|uniref:YopX family protein n=1 Tax=Faecalispora jeddahensis TaxID=1414721 RepID=UPI001898A114|nr:YopX family protein [Faecalispora jeddahensis]